MKDWCKRNKDVDIDYFPVTRKCRTSGINNVYSILHRAV